MKFGEWLFGTGEAPPKSSPMGRTFNLQKRCIQFLDTPFLIFFSSPSGRLEGLSYFNVAKADFTLATASVRASSEAAVERRKQFGAPNEPPPTSAT